MSKLNDSSVLTRREALLLSTTAGLGAALCKPVFASDSIKTAAHQEPGNVSTPRSAVAKTQYGKVRGFVDGGVLTFKGVPYGATTAEENRWLAGQAAYAMDGRVSGFGVRRELPAESASLDKHRADLPLRLGRRLAERRHAQAEHLDAQPDWQATGHVLHAWGRIQLRIVLRAALARGCADGAPS